MSRILPFPTLAMHRSDRIQLFNFPNEATQWSTDAVASTWPHKDTYVEFKLGGYPWLPNGEDTVHARRLMQQILFTFHTNGYALYTSTGIFNLELSKDVLIFEQREPCTLSMFSISLNQHDTLRVIDAPHDIVALITTCIHTNYAGGSVRISEYTSGCQQFKLWSSPWFDGLKPFGTMIVAHVFAQLNSAGWRLYATIKQTTKSDKNAKDSWYFVYCSDFREHCVGGEFDTI